MRKQLSRRRFLQWGAAAAGLAVCPAPSAGAGPAAEPGLTAYADGPQVWVHLDGRVLTCYRANAALKYPYFYPFAGPRTGLSLTAESGLPWPHHRSVFFGCDRVNGANYWQGPLAAGQIISAGPTLGPLTPHSVEIHDRAAWRLPDRDPVLTDERRFTVAVVSAGLWHLDAQLTLTARQDIKVTKTNHALFAVRAADDVTPAGGGCLVNAEGRTGEAGTFGSASAWCDFSGRRVGGVCEGIALLDHPGNPWSPCRWFTRDYGFMSPTPFNWLESGWRLAAGESVRLRYRVVAHAGDAQEADVAGHYRTWSASTPS